MPETRIPGSSRKNRFIFGDAKNKGEDGTGFFAKEKPSPVSEALRGSLARFFFRITAGPGRDWIFYFAGGDGTGFFISQTGLDFSRSSWEAMMRCLGEGSPV